MKIIILALSLLSFLSQAANYAEVGVEVESKRLNGNAYYIPGMSGSATEYEGFISNAGFIVTTEGVVVLMVWVHHLWPMPCCQRLEKLPINQSSS